MNSGTKTHRLNQFGAIVPIVLNGPSGLNLRDPQHLEEPAIRNFHGILSAALREGFLTASPQVADAIEGERVRLERTSRMLDLELERVGIKAKEAHVAPAIVLKGPAVARFYSNPKLRPYSDMDLLVSRNDLEEWELLLRSNGYVIRDEWKESAWRKYRHHVGYHRLVGGTSVSCELHTHLLTDRRTTWFGYEQLIQHTEPSTFSNLVYASAAAQLIILALHLAHHRRDRRRLIWYRDFLEIGEPSNVEAARTLARSWNIDWVLEWALSEVEKFIGERRWNAVRPEKLSRLGNALENDDPGPFVELAIARELGLWRGIRYLSTKFDPRRFSDHGRFDWKEFRYWFVTRSRDAVRASWKRVSRRV